MIGGDKNGFGNDYHTELLIHSIETNGSISFTDSSYNRASIINLDDLVTHQTTYHHFGQSSILFGGGPLVFDTYIASAMSKSINYDDFCIDFWVLMTNDGERTYTDKLTVGFFKPTNGHPNLPDYNNYCGIRISYNIGDLFFEYISGGTTQFQIGGDVLRYTAGNWNHITAVRKNSSEIELYVDGVLASNGTISGSSNANVKNLDYHLATGHRSSQTTLRNFYVDEWRNSIGHYRWNKSFTTPNRMY